MHSFKALKTKIRKAMYGCASRPQPKTYNLQPPVGFTLIELLIVIGIIGFLAAAVLVAVDPVKRIQDSRDARRFAEVNGLLNAILNKQVDDRALYNGMATAPIITHATRSQVIVSSDAGIECDVALTENSPGCHQTLDTTTAGPQKNCVVNISDTGTGKGTAAGAGAQAVVTGAGTAFTTQVSVGDTLTTSNTGNATCIVLTIASDTSITCNANLATAFAGTYTVLHAASALFPTYIATAPIDPRGSGASSCNPGSPACTTPAAGVTTLGATNTGYYLHRTSGNRIEIGACQGEQSTASGAISVKR